MYYTVPKATFKGQVIFLLLPFLFATCRSTPNVDEQLSLGQKTRILFLDSLQATNFIIQDKSEHFFDHISSLDMMIQMKKTYPGDRPRNTILKDYKQFLQTDVAAFTPKEKELLTRVWKKVYADCQSIRKGLFPDAIPLVKTNANHYGPGVYYTREKGIVIPMNELYSGNEDGLYRVMLHELFHIWSRLHPQKRQALYALIGFDKLPVGINELQMEESLRQRILLNPDGIDFSYGIKLIKADGSLIEALPMIQANRADYSTDQPSFFEYLSFQLFPLQKTDQGGYKVVSQANGDPVEELISSTNFMEIISDNTGYIIHPDEIMADNFVLWVQKNRKNTPLDLPLSASGEQLLDRVNTVLSQ